MSTYIDMLNENNKKRYPRKITHTKPLYPEVMMIIRIPK